MCSGKPGCEWPGREIFKRPQTVDPQMPPRPNINPISKAEFEARASHSFRSGYSDGRIADDLWRMTIYQSESVKAGNWLNPNAPDDKKLKDFSPYLKTIAQD